jgi:hypothetical protein
MVQETHSGSGVYGVYHVIGGAGEINRRLTALCAVRYPSPAFTPGPLAQIWWWSDPSGQQMRPAQRKPAPGRR